jgi:hypothetical protein
MCPLCLSSISLTVFGAGSVGVAGTLVARTLARIARRTHNHPK